MEVADAAWGTRLKGQCPSLLLPLSGDAENGSSSEAEHPDESARLPHIGLARAGLSL